MDRVMVKMTLLSAFSALTVCLAAVPRPAGPGGSRTTIDVYRIGAFNIKTFGVTKMGKPEIAAVIRDIVLLYDVILIQEIRDASGDSLDQLDAMLNEFQPFTMSCSIRLGRSSYKEQYCYFYRTDQLILLEELQYEEEPLDVYEREPFSALFTLQARQDFEFALVGLHAKPDFACEEIEALIDVYDDLRDTWKHVDNVFLLGDFNAECSYCRETELQQLEVYSHDYFSWLVTSTEDTTTSSNTDCAYDRIVATGTQLKNAIIPGSEGIFEFEQYFGLSYTEMHDVSDHYPVEVQLYVPS